MERELDTLQTAIVEEIKQTMEKEGLLPVGIRFVPCDHELILLLMAKVQSPTFCHDAIMDGDNIVFNDVPWSLPNKSQFIDEKYFYALRRHEEEIEVADGQGWWKVDMSKEEKCFDPCGNVVGFKKTRAFIRNLNKKKSPKMELRTFWIMYEYILSSYTDDEGNKVQEWVIYKIRNDIKYNTRGRSIIQIEELA